MKDYYERRHPICKMCPLCARKRPPRESQLMAQNNGGDDWVITCADFSICSFRKEVTGRMVGGALRIDGSDGLGFWEAR